MNLHNTRPLMPMKSNEKQCDIHSVSGCWEQPKKIELKLEDMASGEMIGNIKGLK